MSAVDGIAPNGTDTGPLTPVGAGAPEEQRGSQTVAAVERAADVLLYFTRGNGPSLGITDIAAGLGLSKAAVHRVLASLRTRDLVELDENTRKYSLGPMAVVLGLAGLDRLDVRRTAAAELPALSAATGETATLSIRAGGTRVYVDQVTPAREMIMSVSIGVPYPLHAGASSKAFLAFLSDEEIQDYLGAGGGALTPITPSTVTDVPKLLADLELIRERGWADSTGERQSGAASVAAPVRDRTGKPAAVISVCGPAARFAEEKDRAVSELLASTERLSMTLGFRRPS
ncbi:helix-turn-helix domain-containing protein [Nakamurella sp. YIM 132087]|uniref:Helix-turn-helix domain-containing protein n=1 Tax=Nakamurella alba TaxID=2665158 RepID=A0A7K1FSE8_9ACTN|nr:IclR family transcriptional regulator [Nakamurella alba]MTD15764.1 helix-turn-helix domain-containing protein [Nakamurella alba]